MKTVTIQLYSIDELCEESRKRAYERWLSDHDYTWAGEVRDTLKELSRALDIHVYGWSYDSCSHDSGVITWGNTWSAGRLALCGNRARAFLWNHFGDLVLQPKWYLLQPKFPNISAKKRKSRVFFDRTYGGTCPLTGVCFDNDALDPLSYFCLGVKWDDKEKKRVMVPHDERRRWKSMTTEDVVSDCVDSLFRAAQEDCAYHESFEFFVEECESNEWTFERDGRMRNV